MHVPLIFSFGMFENNLGKNRMTLDCKLLKHGLGDKCF